MTRATSDAPGSRHWVDTCSVLSWRPPGRQAIKDDNKSPSFAGHFEGGGGAPVLYRAHRLMEEVHGLPKSHYTPPSGKHSL